MMLSEVPFENLRNGDAVISEKGEKGKIFNLGPKGKMDSPSVDISWPAGETSTWIQYCDKIRYKGREGYMP